MTLALIYGDSQLVQRLLESGTNPKRLNPRTNRNIVLDALFYVDNHRRYLCSNNCFMLCVDPQLLDLLYRTKGLDINEQDQEGNTALIQLMQNLSYCSELTSNYMELKQNMVDFLRLGADITLKNSSKRSFVDELHGFVRWKLCPNNLNFLFELCQVNPDIVDAQSAIGDTSLHMFIRYGLDSCHLEKGDFEKYLKTLLQLNPDPKIRNQEKQQPRKLLLQKMQDASLEADTGKVAKYKSALKMLDEYIAQGPVAKQL